jgi:putative membrane protein
MPQPTDFDLSYCGPAPSLADLATRWNFEPFLLVSLALAALIGWRVVRGKHRSQQLAFGAAWTLAALLFISPLCALTVALFSARVSHHILLTMGVAPLLAFALPAKLGQSLPALPVLVISTIIMWFWHWPDLYVSAFAHPAIYWGMQLSFLASFTALWLLLLRSQSIFSAGLTALAAAIQMGFLGALLVFAPSPLYAPHFATTLSFGLTPLDDQQLAGLIMWVPANLPLLALAVWRLLSLLKSSPLGRADEH